MKRKALFAAVAVAASLTCASCVDHSLNSWISDKDWVFEDKLLGSWVGHDEDEKLTFTFTRQGSGYRLDWVDEKAKTKEIQKFSFDITMGRVSGKLYLDYTPVLPAACTDPTGVLVTHGLARIDLADNSFTLRLVNSGRLENAAKHNQLKDIQFAWQSRDDLLLTSPTTELRAFLLAHAQEDDFFNEPSSSFVRQK